MDQSLSAHYALLLGLDSSWKVADVNLELVAKRVTIHLEHVGGALICPECGSSCSRHDLAPERTWRHLDTMQFETLLKARVPRAACKDCGVKTCAVPWAGKHSQFTLLFEAFAIQVLQTSRCIESARKLLGLNWESAQNIMKRGVERGLKRRDLSKVERVGIDEKSFLRGQNYISSLCDLDGARVLEVVEGRKEEDARKLLKSLPHEVRTGIKAIAMDMWQAFMAAAKKELPDAEVVFDRFHASQHMGDAVDQVRRSEHKQLLKQGDKSLAGTRYDWLRSGDSIHPDDRNTFDDLKESGLKTAKAWALKELLYEFWECRNEAFAESHFARWYSWAVRCRLEPVKKVARMLKRHLAGLLSYFRHRITNAATEGFNSKIQAIKSAARGFRKFENYRVRILFFCGRLDLRPEAAH